MSVPGPLSLVSALFEPSPSFKLGPLTLKALPGTLYWVTGPNGAGKTTLLRGAAGLLTPTAGQVFFSHPPIFIKNAPGSALAVGAALRFWGADASLWGLSSLLTVPLCHLSAGQLQRVRLARLTAQHSPLWLLDEPYAALDATYGALLTELLRDHVAKGGTALVASHTECPLPGAQLIPVGL